MRVTTDEFKISQSTYLLTVGRILALRPVQILAICALVACVAGILADIRWLVIALMLVLIILPMLAAMIYFNYGLRPEGFVNVLPHSIAFSNDAILVNVRFPQQQESDEETVDMPQERRYTFKITPPMRYSVGGSNIIIHLGNPRRGVLIVPYNVFGGEEGLKTALSCLTGREITESENETDKE